jgi:hypothetical protein
VNQPEHRLSSLCAQQRFSLLHQRQRVRNPLGAQATCLCSDACPCSGTRVACLALQPTRLPPQIRAHGTIENLSSQLAIIQTDCAAFGIWERRQLACCRRQAGSLRFPDTWPLDQGQSRRSLR